MTTTAKQLLMPGPASQYSNGPVADITTFVKVSEWVANGLGFWGRADGYDDTPAAGLLDVTDRRPGSTLFLNQPAGQIAIIPKSDAGYLGGRKTLEFGAGTGSIADKQWLDNSSALMPTAGPFAIYLAVHPYSSVMDLLGAPDDRSKLYCTVVNGIVRMQVANSGANVTLDTGLGTSLKNRDLLIGFIRQSDGFLKLRLRKQGDAAWSESLSAAANAGAIVANLRCGRVRNTADAGSNNFYGRWGGMLVQPGNLPAEQQTPFESYLSNYYKIK